VKLTVTLRDGTTLRLKQKHFGPTLTADSADVLKERLRSHTGG
jgi:hypothetical protein